MNRCLGLSLTIALTTALAASGAGILIDHNDTDITALGQAAMQKAKDDGLELHEFVDSLGQSRELSIAKTKIEEAVMWGVKAVTS